MGIKPDIASQKGKELSEVPKETRTNSSASSRRNRRRNRKASPVQTLYHTCKEVFVTGGTGTGTGFIPPPNDVERLRSILDKLKAEDVGLSPSLPYFRIMRSGRPVITYLHLYECEKFSIGIFCLPPSGVLPLHNHPGMTVFSKILFGTMHIKSFDWAEDLPCTTVTLESTNAPEAEAEAEAEARLAKLKVNADFVAPCNTSILYPAAGGNMHCFTAVTACAVLDVLGPPYSDPDGRHCTYYREYPFHHFSVDGISMLENEKDTFAWLQERGKPRELTIIGAPYVGPKIVDS